MVQPNRLPADAPHGFGGAALDRSKPLSFRLDGRTIHGFSGDTVLSALLANGIITAGTHGGTPIGLDESLAPLVSPRSAPGTVLPMERTPALAGLDLTLAESAGPGGLGLLSRLLDRIGSPADALTQKFSDHSTPPWFNATPETTIEVETLIIGGGVAGLSAAEAAGTRALLVERRLWLGGDARYFGTTGDETPPDRLIAGLIEAQAAEILLGTEVFALAGTTARAHQVRIENGRPVTRVIEIVAGQVVLATGALERLPLFAGNLMPGITGAIAAFHRAERHGVWAGKRTLLSTPSGFGYRLALLAKDAGVDVLRIADTRLAPNSRFIDFCKASGVSFTSGLLPRSAVLAGKGQSGLAIDFAVAIDDIEQETGVTRTDQFIAGGGLQPDLSLWLQAGGEANWTADRLEARGTLPGVRLVGSAAGYRRSAACVASGRAAITGKPDVIDDPVIEAIYETPDAPTPVGPFLFAPPTYLARGRGLARRPAEPGAFAPLSALSLGEVIASVQLGAHPAAVAGRVAAERVLWSVDLVDSGWKVPVAPPSAELPAYLTGRFGPRPQLSVVRSADARYFERGSLIFAGSDLREPELAVGVIVGKVPDGSVGGLALIEKAASAAETRLFVRDSGGAVPIETIKPA